MTQKKMTMENAGSLPAALLAAQASIDGVGKDATNSFHRYRYTSAEGMISACRDALHGAGLAFQRTGWRLEQDGATVVSTFALRHPASGQAETYEVPWIVVVEKGRPVDKALAGALTTSLGYLLRDLLLLPREDEDGSMDKRNDDEKRPQPSVGFKQRPEPKAGSVSAINERLAQESSKQASPAVAREIAEGAFEELQSRKHGGKDYLIATFVAAEDGRKTEMVVSDELAAAVRKASETRKRLSVEWIVRAGRTAILWQIEPAARKEGSDEALPF